MIYTYNKRQRDALFLKFIFGIKLYIFRTVPLSIIRSFSLYTAVVYVIQAMLTACEQAVSIICMYCCVYSEKILMMDRGTVRNMYSFIPKINVRN